MKYSWEKTVDQTLAEYQEILGVSTTQSPAVAPVKVIEVGQFDMSPQNPELDKLLEDGEEAARERQYNLAHELLEKAERLNPQSVRALRARGAIFMAENLIAQARSYFERALRLNSSDAKSLSGLGMCELHEGRTESSYNYILRALEVDPFQLVAILQLVQTSYMLERFDSLEMVLRRYLDKHNEDVEMRYCLAGCLFKQDKILESESELTSVIAANPNHKGAQQLKEMIAEKKQAVTTEVESAYSDRIRELDIAKKEKRHDYVIEMSNQYLNDQGLTKADRQALCCLKAEALVFSDQVEEADRIFAELLNSDSQCARALCGRGAIASSRGQSDMARQYFEQAVKIAPRSDIAIAGLGMIQQADQKIESAWDLYRQALAINPENGRALYGVIEIGYQTKRLEEIEQAIQGYLDCHPGDLNYLYSLAGCYYAQEKLAEAKSEVEKILLFDPNNANARDLKKLIDERKTNQLKGIISEGRAAL